MPVSKAQQKAVNKYMAEKYDRINLVVPKGRREELRAKAEAAGKSLNAYLIGLIEGETPAPAPQAPQYITPEDLDKATKAAQADGKSLTDWISKAINDTAARDQNIRDIYKR